MMVNKCWLQKDAGAIDVNERQEMTLKFKPASMAEMKLLGDDLPDGYVAGWASTPDLDYYRHVVMKGAFDESIREKSLNGPKGIKLLIDHDRSKLAGTIKVLETRGESLWIEAQLNLEISYVKDRYLAAKDNGGVSFSVGFYLEDYQFKKGADGDEYLQIDRGELEEVSLVVFPGNPNATNLFIKHRDELHAASTISEFEKALVACGLVKSRNDAQRITQAVKQSKAFGPVAPVAPKPAPVAKELDSLSSLLVEFKNVCS